MYAVMAMLVATLVICAAGPALLAWGNAGVKRGGKPGPFLPVETKTTEQSTRRVPFDVIG